MGLQSRHMKVTRRHEVEIIHKVMFRVNDATSSIDDAILWSFILIPVVLILDLSSDGMDNDSCCLRLSRIKRLRNNGPTSQSNYPPNRS
jgi:hypothetical protein